jgi:hypothetical protein
MLKPRRSVRLIAQALQQAFGTVLRKSRRTERLTGFLFRQWKFQSEIKNIPIGSVLLNAHAIGKDKIIKYIDIYHKRR